MSSAFVKGKLKAAREALAKKEYQGASEFAAQVLEYEPENYNAHVFLGLALLELKQYDKSEQTYRKAIELNPNQILAWQGLAKFYERTEKWEEQADTLKQLASLFSSSNDASKCAETLQKLIDLRRERGTRAQVIDTLCLLLPESDLYPVLSTLPTPDPTNPSSTLTLDIQTAIHDSLPVLEEIVLLTERLEEDTINKEYARRKTRMNAPPREELQREVAQEVLGTSRLPHFFNEVLNHPGASDALRRATESKLLRHRQRYMNALPATGNRSDEKRTVAREIEQLVHGAVILSIPDELAWMIFIEGKDSDSIEGYDFKTLNQFTELFPTLPFSSLISSYFSYIGISFDEEDSDEEDQPNDNGNNDPFDMILESYTSLTDSVLANRILAEVYIHESDWANCIKVTESGLEVLRRTEMNWGRKLNQVRKAFNVALATSLVHLFPPKHHARALGVIDEVFAVDPDNISCTMGRAYISECSGHWSEAEVLFQKIRSLIPEDLDVGLRAREEAAWCHVKCNRLEDGKIGLQQVLDTVKDLEDRKEDLARCFWKLGRCYWEMGDGQREEAYRCFITSLKHYSAFAPSFTALGIYYSEFADPPDPIRASKCFQKAFELDAREADAAERLAKGFAEEREWDLVEIVARRTIEGEGGLDAGIQGGASITMARYLPTNAWAWKAIGVVDLNRGNYAPAIQAFQTALRADPDDQLSWVRLGEAYSKAGRYAAAVKALGRARELQPDDWVCCYFIGDLQRQTGQFDEAIQSFQTILENRKSEVGVLVSLAQTLLELGRSERSTGFIARAEGSFVAGIHVVLQVVRDIPGFRAVAWKIVADALFHLSSHSPFADASSIFEILTEVVSLIGADPGRRILNILPSDLKPRNLSINESDVLAVAIAAYNSRIDLVPSDSPASSSAWFDLGIALRAWAGKTPSSEKQEVAQKQAIDCVKEALQKDPGNDTFWNALGNLYFTSQAKTAQHAYIKALEIDSKNVHTWTNLGLLYLHNDDLELANEAFYKAQTLDPDCTTAWIGQGLVASGNGHDKEARALFEHAVSLTADVPEADLEFASRTFVKLSSTPSSNVVSTAYLPAFFILDRYCKQRPGDSTALHLFGLVCERLGQPELGEDLLQRAIAILEAVYEDTEDPIIEKQFTIANSNLARLHLSLHNYEGALELFKSALSLLSEETSDPTTLALRVQAHFGSGLASLKLGELDVGLSSLQTAVDAAGANALLRGQVTVLLAQALWTLGSEEFRESAKSLLLECISTDPENLAAINALASMGILTEDDSLVDAALSEILSLPLEQRHELDPCRDVDYLLIQHHLGQSDAVQALSVAQKALFAEPSRVEKRQEVAKLTLQQGQHESALAIITDSVTGDDDLEEVRKSLALRAIAQASSDVAEGKRQAQKAVLMAPWELRNWQALAYVRVNGV